MVRAASGVGTSLFSVGDGPSGGRRSQPENGEAGEVGGCGEQVEVGVDFEGAAYSCSSSAVAAAHQMGKLSFDLWACGPVVGPPGGVLLAGPSVGECCFVNTDLDVSAGLGGRALTP